MYLFDLVVILIGIIFEVMTCIYFVMYSFIYLMKFLMKRKDRRVVSILELHQTHLGNLRKSELLLFTLSLLNQQLQGQSSRLIDLSKVPQVIATFSQRWKLPSSEKHMLYIQLIQAGRRAGEQAGGSSEAADGSKEDTSKVARGTANFSNTLCVCVCT